MNNTQQKTNSSSDYNGINEENADFINKWIDGFFETSDIPIDNETMWSDKTALVQKGYTKDEINIIINYVKKNGVENICTVLNYLFGNDKVHLSRDIVHKNNTLISNYMIYLQTNIFGVVKFEIGSTPFIKSRVNIINIFERYNDILHIINKIDISSVADLDSEEFEERKFDGELRFRKPLVMSDKRFYEILNFLIDYIQQEYNHIDCYLPKCIIEAILREYDFCMDNNLTSFFYG